MSAVEENKPSNEELKSPDKKQIEEEEKEIMLKSDIENIEMVVEPKATEPEGPVKSALSGEITEQGREVKPKFIPIGAIKMPGFFTRNSDKGKDEEKTEKEGEEKPQEGSKIHHRLQFLHSCPFTQFLHHKGEENVDPNTETNQRRFPKMPNLSKINLPNVKLPKIIQKYTSRDPEATLASMETLEDKPNDAANDGMENVKLDGGDEVEGKVATKMPLKERIRQKNFIIDDIVVCAVVILVLIAVIIGIVIGARAGPPAERPLRLGKFMTTLTTCGPVEGVLNESVYKFHNIPYAVPPIGERRFTYAQPLNNISMCWNGTLPAHNPGPVCMQFLENGTIAGQEDCLTLDIVTPHVRYDYPLPVVVLIGANSLTGGISPLQPSALYARTQEIVFVRPNFRLGVFGFLSLDILTKEKYPPTSGNYGLSDLMVALEWIQNNIRHFGGDETSVTLLGHRAGATLTAAITTVRQAQNLYSRVWLSSPSVIFPGEVPEKAQNEQFKTISTCRTAECLRRLSSTEILTATPDVWLESNIANLPQPGEMKQSGLVLDGDLLRLHAYESWAAQKKAKTTLNKSKEYKPMVFGTTQHSAHSSLLQMKHLLWSPEIVEKMVNDSVIGQMNLTQEAFKHINKTYTGLIELISSVRTTCPLVSLARINLALPMYFVKASGAGGGINGSGIADINADVTAILGTFDSEVVEHRRFMTSMQHLFYQYVHDGHFPGRDSVLLAVDQDVFPMDTPAICDFLITQDIVPRYAHVD